ncbi:MAG: ACP S-malonyltransferase [Acidiferrobacterales bacterium]|nr:ACP S-malonyltransferase [Acidiferrobacterales bacterium]
MRAFLFLFPGQGAQYVGIGKDLIAEFPLAAQIYDQASSILGYDMIALCNDETGDDINLTRYTQPVLLTHSHACMQVFLHQTSQKYRPGFACGHSLGEYGALIAAQALEFESALKLVSARGACMGQHGGGEMLALALSENQLTPLIESGRCEIAACNLPEQTVVGGMPEELDQLALRIEEAFPGKPSTRLKTEGAFHTSHMFPAAQEFQSHLDDADIRTPTIPVASNVTGGFHDSQAEAIKRNLYLQLFKPVRWHRNLMTIAESGIDAVIEFGGGLGGGNDPADKRPNLAGTVMRSYRGLSPRPAYHSVINLKTLHDTIGKLETA